MMIKRLISKRIKLKLLRILPLIGIYNKNLEEDRVLLEKTIFPYFIQKEAYQKVVFIGVGWYTMEYNKLFKRKEFWTIDFNPKYKIYGSKRHIIDSMENMDRHFENNTIDLIICNGIYGWGLSDPKNIEKAFNVCFNILRTGGVLIIGWNDLPEHRPVPFGEINALKLFQPYVFEPLGVQTKKTNLNNRHAYSFYEKS